MCTRYSFTVRKETITQRFGISIDGDLKASYNVSASQEAYIITNELPRKLDRMIWGLIPQWSNDGTNNGKLINARIEGIGSSSSFRIPIRQKRCLVLADSYYEWKRQGLKKRPFRVVQPNQPLLVMAGVWDIWQDGGKVVKSFSIITIPSVDNLVTINDRMPLILDSPQLQDLWLDEVNLEDVFQIIKEAKVEELKYYPISQKVNIIGFSSEELHEELAS